MALSPLNTFTNGHNCFAVQNSTMVVHYKDYKKVFYRNIIMECLKNVQDEW